MGRAQILLADDNTEVRAALRLVLEHQNGLEIIGETRDAVNLLAQAASSCPQIILLDADLPGLQPARRAARSSLTDLVETLRHLCPAVHLIALSSRPNMEQECLLAGVDAFFCKSDPPDALLARLNSWASSV